MFAGCAFAPLSSRIGDRTEGQYQKAYDLGVPAAEKIIKVWPYVSGLIKGTFAENYELELTVQFQRTVRALDELADKKELTDEDKGKVIGNVNRLEYLAGKEFQERYGATILGLIKAMM
jgi:hypothetical protein